MRNAKRRDSGRAPWAGSACPGGADVDRTKGDAEAGDLAIRVACSVPGRMTLAGRTLEVGPEDTDLAVEPGTHTFVVEAGGLRFVGAIELREGTHFVLRFDPVERYVSWAEEIYGSK